MRKLMMLITLISAAAFAAASPVRLQSDNVVVGQPATSNNKTLEFNLGQGSANPKVRANKTSGQLEFANDGVNFAGIGSGSGGSGGIELLQNSGFETAYNNWTPSGLTPNAVTSGAYLLFGGGSVTMTSTGTGQGLSQSVIVPQGLAGANCLASLQYKGGDANWTMHATAGGNDLGKPKVLLPTASGQTSGPRDINFICPAAGSTVTIQVVSSGAAALIALDNTHLGSATNIFQVSQGGAFVGSVVYDQSSGGSGAGAFTWAASGSPADATTKTFSSPAAIAQGSALQVSEATGNQFGINFTDGPGDYDVAVQFANNYVSCPGGLATSMQIVDESSNVVASNFYEIAATGNNLPWINLKGRISYTAPGTHNWHVRATPSCDISTYVNSGGSASVIVHKYITKAQAAVSSSCSGTGSCVNTAVVLVANTCTSTPCTVTSQNVPWISSISRTGTGIYVLNFNTGFFTVPPACTVSTSNYESTVFNTTTGSVSIGSASGPGTNVDAAFTVSCHKLGSDLSSMESPILVGSITQPSPGAMNFFSGHFADVSGENVDCTAPTCTLTRASVPAGLTVTGNGSYRYQINVPSGYCSQAPICSFTVADNVRNAFAGLPPTGDGIVNTPTVYTFDGRDAATGSSVIYGDFMCSCSK